MGRQSGIWWRHDLHTHEDLAGCLSRFPDTQEGNLQASLFLWNNRHWQRAGYLRGLLAYFKSIGVTDQEGLQAWARTALFERDFQGRVTVVTDVIMGQVRTHLR